MLTMLFSASCQVELQSSRESATNSVEETQTAVTSAQYHRSESEQKQRETVQKGNIYTSKEDVASYLHQFGELPKNYIRKKEAEKLGWDSSKGNLWKVTDQKSIGGDVFGNREGKLPKKKGRTYFECDIDYMGGFRNGKRIVYSDDGLIFYSEDHYNTFLQMY